MTEIDPSYWEPPDDPEAEDRFGEAFERAIAEANARIESCHEVAACPKCGAPVGRRCCRMPAGYPPSDIRHETKRPHQERWTQVVPAR